MEHIHLNIRISDRTYPVKVEPAAARRLQSAEELVRLRMEEYKSTYPSSDKTDQLAMTALHFAHAGLLDTTQNSAEMAASEPDLSAVSASVERILSLFDRRSLSVADSEST
jgi:cell division protein ZapA (FtsZ GTPase activity inhibitor)